MKRIALFSAVAMLFVAFILPGCGTKLDEALVTEFNAKKTEAEKLIADVTAGVATFKADHTAWLGKLDEAAKAPKADTAKINMFKAHITEHNNVDAGFTGLMDSLKSMLGGKLESNDAYKTAVAGVGSTIATLTTNFKAEQDHHAKLGSDIMAFLGGGAAPATAAATEAAKADPNGPHATAKKTPGGDAVKTRTNPSGTTPAKPLSEEKPHIKEMSKEGEQVKTGGRGQVKTK